MNRLTINEIADRLRLDKEDVRGMIKVFAMTGLVEIKGERRQANNRGRPEHVFEFSDHFLDKVSKLFSEAKLI